MAATTLTGLIEETLSDLLREISDKIALDELVYCSMLAMDARDWAIYRSKLTDDAVFDFVDSGAAIDDSAEPVVGGDKFVEVLSSVIDGFDSTQHVVTNMYHSVGGNRAKTHCYVVAEHFLNNACGDKSISSGAHCEIECDKTRFGWRISKLRLHNLWYRGNTSLFQLAAQRSSSAAPSFG